MITFQFTLVAKATIGAASGPAPSLRGFGGRLSGRANIFQGGVCPSTQHARPLCSDSLRAFCTVGAARALRACGARLAGNELAEAPSGSTTAPMGRSGQVDSTTMPIAV